MRELLLTLTITLTSLVAIDLGLSYGFAKSIAEEEIDLERDEAFSIQVNRQMEMIRTVGLERFDQVLEDWQGLPKDKGDKELRVFLIGNSTAMFSIVPERVELQLAEALPEWRPIVTSLLLQGARSIDNALLVEAALARGADVVVLTPNPKGLQPWGAWGTVFGTSFDPNRIGIPPKRSLTDWFQDHWRLYRERERIRARIRTVIPRWLGGTESLEMSAALIEIADAAADGDIENLLETYKNHNMDWLVMAPFSGLILPKNSPVFDTVRTTAETIQRSGAIGIAIYMPMNPIFRDIETMRPYAWMMVDDAYVRALGDNVLNVYANHGLYTANRLDFLPAEAFVDRVHVNGRGSPLFSDETARIIAEAVRDSEANSSTQ